MNVDEPLDDIEIRRLAEQINSIDLNSDKRKREYVDPYTIPVIAVGSGSIPETEYNYDEDAIIQDDDDEDLFQIKHRLLENMNMDMDISDTENNDIDDSDVEEINTDFDEIRRLRDELDMLRTETAQKRIPFPEGSTIRFTMVDGVRYLQVCQPAPPAPALTIDDLSCDSDGDDV
jgi:hypothetical protein